MPLLYALGQHGALEAVDSQLGPDEDIYGFLDDIYIVCQPERVCNIFEILRTELKRHAGIDINIGKTKVWNSGGICPNGIASLGQGAWKGDHNLLPKEQGIKIIGCPIGHTDFVHHFIEGILEKHRELTNRIPQLEDVQKAWLLLYYCANSRANYYTRVVPPEYIGVYARGHD